MNCPCCGRTWVGPGDCYFCMWWGSTVLAGVPAESLDPIIRKEKERYAVTFQSTGKGGYYAVRPGSVEARSGNTAFSYP